MIKFVNNDATHSAAFILALATSTTAVLHHHHCCSAWLHHHHHCCDNTAVLTAESRASGKRFPSGASHARPASPSGRQGQRGQLDTVSLLSPKHFPSGRRLFIERKMTHFVPRGSVLLRPTYCTTNTSHVRSALTALTSAASTHHKSLEWPLERRRSPQDP